MRLSTSTNIMDRYQRTQGAVSMEECIYACHQAGYRVLDMNFCDMSNEDMPLAKDDWQSWTEQIGTLAQQLGIIFSQSHAHFYNFLNPNVANRAFHEEMIRRSIIASGMLGIPWMTMHAGTDTTHQGYSNKLSLEGNIAYLTPYIEMAQKNGVGVTLENMFDPTPQQRTFTAATDQLLELVDAFDPATVGVCWDFGHANLVGMNQVESLREVGGKRLKAVHVADNYGVRDDHLLPFYGTMDWSPLVAVLKEIGYAGDFTYEITPFLDRVPLPLRQTALLHTVEVGEYLIGLGDA